MMMMFKKEEQNYSLSHYKTFQCCKLRQSLKGSAEYSKTWSAERKMAKQSSTNLQNKRSSNCLTEFSLCINDDSFIPLSFINVGIPSNLKSTQQQTGEISCVNEILFSIMYCRRVLMVVCWRYRSYYGVIEGHFNANGCVSTLMNDD